MRGEEFAEVNGTRLHYEVRGAGEPLVLIHGLGVDFRLWDAQAAFLALRYKVIRYDVRGFGQSAVPGTAPYAHADDLNALLDYLGIPRAVIIGQSMGGELALNFALAYPDRVAALVLIDSALAGYTFSPGWNESWGPAAVQIQTVGMQAGARALLQHPLHEAIRRQPAASARLTDLIADWSGWQMKNADPVRQPDPPAATQLGKITASTLIVVGELDVPDFQAIANLLHAKITGSRFVTVPGVGHVVPLEAPDALNRIMQEFLDTLGK